LRGGVLQLKRNNVRRTGDLVPTQYSESRRFDADPQAIREAIGQVLAHLGATYVVWSPDGSQVNAVQRIPPLSWGQQLTISVGDSGDVCVSSENWFRFQFFDYGWNTWNCQFILYSISEYLSTGRIPEFGAGPD
jgi:hypothetical protein